MIYLPMTVDAAVSIGGNESNAMQLAYYIAPFICRREYRYQYHPHTHQYDTISIKHYRH